MVNVSRRQSGQIDNFKSETKKTMGKLEEIGQETGSTVRKLEEIGNETGSTVRKLEEIGNETGSTVRKLEEIGNETGRTIKKVEEIGKETGSTVRKLEEIGNETGSTVRKLEEIGQETGCTIKKVEKIGMETQSITITLHTDLVTKENIKNFFPKTAGEDEKHILFFPGDYDRKTLPSINAGDSYAMYVISGLLGADLHLKPIDRHAKAGSLEAQKIHDDLNCNAILLCDVNLALKDLFNFEEFGNVSDIKPKPNSNDLPCWFATYDTGTRYETSYFINMYHPESGHVGSLISPSENSCIEAADYPKGKPYEPNSIQKDFGIIARLSKVNYNYIVIAGIHGYGTAIVAHFLNNLIRGKKSWDNNIYHNIFFSKYNFISIIQGGFDQTNFYVRESVIQHEEVSRIWVEQGGKWMIADDFLAR
jgi:hypothetical protein